MSRTHTKHLLLMLFQACFVSKRDMGLVCAAGPGLLLHRDIRQPWVHGAARLLQVPQHRLYLHPASPGASACAACQRGARSAAAAGRSCPCPSAACGSPSAHSCCGGACACTYCGGTCACPCCGGTCTRPCLGSTCPCPCRGSTCTCPCRGGTSTCPRRGGTCTCSHCGGTCSCPHCGGTSTRPCCGRPCTRTYCYSACYCSRGKGHHQSISYTRHKRTNVSHEAFKHAVHDLTGLVLVGKLYAWAFCILTASPCCQARASDKSSHACLVSREPCRCRCPTPRHPAPRHPVLHHPVLYCQVSHLQAHQAPRHQALPGWQTLMTSCCDVGWMMLESC